MARAVGGKLSKEGIAQIRAKMHPAKICVDAQCYATGFYEEREDSICSQGGFWRAGDRKGEWVGGQQG